MARIFLWLLSSHILLLAGHELLKVCQGLLRLLVVQGSASQLAGHRPSLGTALFVQVMCTGAILVSSCLFFSLSLFSLDGGTLLAMQSLLAEPALGWASPCLFLVGLFFLLACLMGGFAGPVTMTGSEG